jgi:hypothetical protein
MSLMQAYSKRTGSRPALTIAPSHLPFAPRPGDDAQAMPPRTTPLLLAAALLLPTACDEQGKGAPASPEAAPALAPAAPAPAPPPEVRAPDIIVDPSHVSIGNERVATGEPGLADKIGVFLAGRPMIEGRTVELVAMRNAKPSQVLATVAAVRRARATGAAIKTEARDTTTQRLPLSFANPTDSCTTVAWIAKDAAIDVWPISGGRAKKIYKGLAGPDMTLGTDAIRAVAAGCNASVLVAGADEAMTWGLVFDLATTALAAPGSRASAVVLVASAVPGRKLTFD